MKSFTRPGRALVVILLGALMWAGCGSDTDTATTDQTDPVVTGEPSVQLEATADAVSGYNVHVTSTDFDTSAGTASATNVDGEGFYYLTVNGERLLRFYDDWIHVDNLPSGEVVLGVELASNDDEPILVDGEAVAASTTIDIAEHDHTDGSHSHGEGEMEYVELATPDPSIALTVEADPISGANVKIDLSGLTLAPEHASGEHVDGEGHMHLYIDGVKVARLYGSTYHYGAELTGEHEFLVAANTNDHRPYMVDNDPLEATAIFDADS